jgi:hypothetical protein
MTHSDFVEPGVNAKRILGSPFVRRLFFWILKVVVAVL